MGREMSNCKSLETKNQIAKKRVIWISVFPAESKHSFICKESNSNWNSKGKQTNKTKQKKPTMGSWMFERWSKLLSRLQNLYPWTSSEFKQKRLWALLWVGNSSVLYSHIRAVCYHSNLQTTGNVLPKAVSVSVLTQLLGAVSHHHPCAFKPRTWKPPDNNSSQQIRF